MKHNITLLNIDFNGYLKFCGSVFFSFSIPFMIFSLFDNILDLKIISIQEQGNYLSIGGIIGTLLAPIWMYLLGIIIGVFSYFPFKYYIKLVPLKLEITLRD